MCVSVDVIFVGEGIIVGLGYVRILSFFFSGFVSDFVKCFSLVRCCCCS